MPSSDELLAYVGFTADDEARLARLWPVVEPHAPAIADRFYAAAQRAAKSQAILQDAELLGRLKATLVDWMKELCLGPHDEAYDVLRQRIGLMHVRAGLQSETMFMGMTLLREDMIRIGCNALGDEAEATILALMRVIDVDLAIMVQAYMETREERQLLQLRELIVSHLPTAAVVLDAEHRVLSATPRAREVVGGALGDPLEECLAPELQTAADLETRILRARESGRTVVLPCVDATIDGQARAFRITIQPLDHAIAAVVLHIEDITDVVGSQKQVERAEHLAGLGVMAASIAHEVRNPLAGIRAAVQVVRASLPPDDIRAAVLEKVEAQASRLGALAGDLLTFARPINVRALPVDLLAVVQAAVSLEVAPVEVSGAGTANADGALLTQVLSNLVQNAAQAGAKKIHVVVNGPTIRVVDDGPGIPEGQETKIFEPFFTTKTRGTGLGLPIARNLIEAMGGELTPCPSPFGGAGFAMRLQPAGAL